MRKPRPWEVRAGVEDTPILGQFLALLDHLPVF